MILCLDNVLTPDELIGFKEQLATGQFSEGKTTAGWHARLVKENTQLNNQSPQAQTLITQVKEALQRHPVFSMATMPKTIHSVVLSRYDQGMFYGSHVDNAFMGQGERFRSDISLTLFLTNPSDYEGGELVIEQLDGERSFKLPAGSMVLYPSHTLHRVEMVKSGVRMAAVAWIQSLVRDPSQREILFELDTVRRSIFHKEGKSTEFDLLSKCYANLLRQWGES